MLFVAGSNEFERDQRTLNRAFDCDASVLKDTFMVIILMIFCCDLDDMSIKLWDWDKRWQNIQTFEGHGHYVMQIVINPKDNNQFASASLDKTVKVHRLHGSPLFSMTIISSCYLLFRARH